MLDGNPGIGVSLNPRFVLNIQIKNLPLRNKNQTDLEIESCWIKKKFRTQTSSIFKIPQKVSHEWEFFIRAFQLVFQQNKEKTNTCFQNKKIQIKIDCHWQPTEGLGSSSAIVACLLGFRESLFRNPKNLNSRFQALFLEGRKIIQILQGGQASGLDLAVQLWGGAVCVQSSRSLRNQVKPLKHFKLPRNLILIHTYKKFSTPSLIKKIKSGNQKMNSHFFRPIVESTNKFLKSDKALNHWRQAIVEHFNAFKDKPLFVPTPLGKEMNSWLQLEYVEAIKTTGAGGGDALLGLMVRENLSLFKNELQKKRYKLRSDSEFGTKGLTVQRHDL